MAAAVVVALAAAGAGAYVAGLRFGGYNSAASTAPRAPSSGAGTTTSTSTTTVPASPTTITAVPTGPQIATQISDMLAASAADRQAVVQAAAELTSCSNPGGALADFQTLETHRRSLLHRLEEIDASRLGDGALIKADLLAAWQASLAADHAYATWANDERGSCVPNQDPNAGNVNAANQAATQAKAAFAAVWNPVATRLGLPTVNQGTF